MNRRSILAGKSFLIILLILLVTGCTCDKPEDNSNLDMLIKSEVETAVSMLGAVYQKVEDSTMTIDEAQILAAHLLRELRYGSDGYFWADTREGVNVVLYGREDVEGKNRLEAQDEKGNYFVKDLLAMAEQGGGYVEYYFTKLGQKEAQPKRSYIQMFEPFGWAVGTGYYR